MTCQSPKSPGGFHCSHWYTGGGCHYCGDPPIPTFETREEPAPYQAIWEWPDGSYAIVSDYQLLVEVRRVNFQLQLAPLLGAHDDPQRVREIQSPDDDDDFRPGR